MVEKNQIIAVTKLIVFFDGHLIDKTCQEAQSITSKQHLTGFWRIEYSTKSLAYTRFTVLNPNLSSKQF